jgi:hypothetical protein
MIRAWLRRHVPGWKDMKIQDAAKYLGFFLGPRAGAIQWERPMGKFGNRCIQTKNKDLPLALAVTQFNSRAVPVLGYVSQLAHPPNNIIRTELTSILQSLSLAGNSMNTSAAYSLRTFLGVDPVRPSIYMEACMLRAAFKTFDGYVRMHDDLAETALLNSDCNNAVSTIIPPGWDSSAFCTNLRDASQFRNLRYAPKCVASLSKSVYEWKSGVGGKSLQKKFTIAST